MNWKTIGIKIRRMRGVSSDDPTIFQVITTEDEFLYLDGVTDDPKTAMDEAIKFIRSQFPELQEIEEHGKDRSSS